MWEIHLGSVDYFFAGAVAACNANGLGTVMSLLPTCGSGRSRVRSAAIFGARQFVSRIVNDVPVLASWKSRNLETYKSCRQHDDREQQKAFQKPNGEHASIRKDANRRFSSQSFRGTGQRGLYGGFKFFPGRGPLDKQARWFGPLDRSCRNCVNGSHWL